MTQKRHNTNTHMKTNQTAPLNILGCEPELIELLAKGQKPIFRQLRVCTFLSLVAAFALLATSSSTATTVLFHDQPTWLAQVGGAGSATVFHFDGPTEQGGLAANDPAITPSYASQGVTFLPFTGTSVFPVISRNQGFQIPDPTRDGLLGNNSSPNPTSDLDGRAIKFDFSIAANSVGVFTNRLNDGDGGFLRAFDSSMNVIGEVDLSPGVFGGLITDQVISHVSIVNTYNSDITFGIWDLQFSQSGVVPEPSSAVLLGFGFAALAIARRQRRKSNLMRRALEFERNA